MRIDSQIGSAISRVQKSLGEEFHVTNFEYDESGGDNPYADGDWVETSDSPISVPTRVEYPDSGVDRTSADGAGASVETDATLHIESDAVTVHRGTDDETRATEFLNTATGVRYRTVNVTHKTYAVSVDVEEI